MKKSLVFRIISTIVFALLLYYFMLPPINLHAPSFYSFIITVFIFYLVISIPSLFEKLSNSFSGKKMVVVKGLDLDKKIKYGFYLIVASFLSIILINIVLSPVFNSKSYYNRIFINEEGNFASDIEEVDFNRIPLLDKDSSQKLGDRVMGQMTDLVSQFYVSNLYTQINYNEDIVRVTPLEYSSFIKYFTNRKNGVPAYITVNSVSGKAELTRLDKGMKYMPSSLFFENLYRKIRFSYPAEVFGEESFEIDNDGNPYWIIPTIKYSGIGLRREVSGVIIFDPITGESSKYEVSSIPTWVDHVYSADLIIEQVNDWGQYKNGFLNTIFGQKGVVATTEGYNYTIMNDDVYLYTGITSVVSDESNIGFILTNMRTKETTFYEIAGAEEYSAMASAEGQVQQMNYIASFPLLINYKGNPTYLLSLKDNAGLVKMYAFVDVKDYQKVVVTDSSKGIEVAAQNYLSENELINKEELVSKTIKIKDIFSVVIDGNSYYYIVDNSGLMYKSSIKVNRDILPFLKSGDELSISFDDSALVKEIVEIKK